MNRNNYKVEWNDEKSKESFIAIMETAVVMKAAIDTLEGNIKERAIGMLIEKLNFAEGHSNNAHITSLSLATRENWMHQYDVLLKIYNAC